MSHGAVRYYSMSPKFSATEMSSMSLCRNGVNLMGELAYNMLRRLIFISIGVGLTFYFIQGLSNTDQLLKFIPTYSAENNYSTIYKWPRGCSEEYYKGLDTQHWFFSAEIPRACASPEYYVDRGDNLGSSFNHGRANVTHYFRISNDIANIQCRKEIFKNEECEISDIKKDYFSTSNQTIRNFRCRVPGQEREILTSNEKYPGATCVPM